jgi:xanthine/CO dehydrogenase XdhC/CoxF family maturation factor
MIVKAARELRERKQSFLIATVVRVDGSSYRRPGARMLITEERWVAGSVSGGCVEGDVVKKGWWRTREGAPVVVRYDVRGGDEVGGGFGVGCEGVVDILLERPSEGHVDPIDFLERAIRTQEAGALATVLRSNWSEVHVGARVGVWTGGAREANGVPSELEDCLVRDLREALATGMPLYPSYAIGSGVVEAVVELVRPPPRIFVFGTGHDAMPVVDLARAMGWETIVASTESHWATRARFPRADEIVIGSLGELATKVDASDRPLALVMGHNFESDRGVLSMLLGSRAKYIGVLGPRRRTAKMLLDLLGSSAIDDERVHGPAGLDLGAESPEEIALSMIAEMQSVLTSSTADRLRDRRGPIHQEVTP